MKGRMAFVVVRCASHSPPQFAPQPLAGGWGPCGAACSLHSRRGSRQGRSLGLHSVEKSGVAATCPDAATTATGATGVTTGTGAAGGGICTCICWPATTPAGTVTSIGGSGPSGPSGSTLARHTSLSKACAKENRSARRMGPYCICMPGPRPGGTVIVTVVGAVVGTAATATCCVGMGCAVIPA